MMQKDPKTVEFFKHHVPKNVVVQREVEVPV